MVWIMQVDVEINPFALGGNLKFLVPLNVVEVGANENFRDIPVPEFVGFFLGVGVRFEMEFVVWRHKQEVNILLCPTGAQDCTGTRDQLSESVSFNRHNLRVTPERRGWIEREG
jgi:hypothetical protein